jgi:hypothetical protein
MSTAHSQALYATGTSNDILARLCASLPKLPSVLRYYDEFDDTVRSIKNPENQPIFDLLFGGIRTRLDFTRIGNECGLIFKHVFAFVLAQDLSVRTAASYLTSAHHLTSADVAMLVDAGPTRIGAVWKTLRARALPAGAYIASKYVLHLLCAYRLNGWSNDDRTFSAPPSPYLPEINMPVSDLERCFCLLMKRRSSFGTWIRS